jgi:hypothetical protein
MRRQLRDSGPVGKCLRPSIHALQAEGSMFRPHTSIGTIDPNTAYFNMLQHAHVACFCLQPQQDSTGVLTVCRAIMLLS